MTGVEVLATEEVVTGWSFNWLGFALTVAAVMFIVVLVCINNCKTVKTFLQVVGIVGGISGLMLGLLVGKITEIPREYETHYKVTFSDEVSLNEFLERYEIIYQEGQIYTIKELE